MQTDSGNNWCLLPRIKLTSTQSCSECSSDFRHLLMPLETMILDRSKVDIHFLFPFFLLLLFVWLLVLTLLTLLMDALHMLCCEIYSSTNQDVRALPRQSWSYTAMHCSNHDGCWRNVPKCHCCTRRSLTGKLPNL